MFKYLLAVECLSTYLQLRAYAHVSCYAAEYVIELSDCCVWLSWCLVHFAMENIWRLAGFALRYGCMALIFMDGSVPCFRLLVCKTYDSLQAPCVSYGLARCWVRFWSLMICMVLFELAFWLWKKLLKALIESIKLSLHVSALLIDLFNSIRALSV